MTAPKPLPHEGHLMAAVLQDTIAHRHTVARELTHKHRIENVYITSMSQLSRDEYVFGGFLPQSNVHLWNLRTHAQDVTLPLVEVGRQIGTAISHQYLGVGHDRAFILDDLSFTTTPALHQVDWQSSETIWGTLSVHQRMTDDTGRLTGIQASGQIFAGEQHIATQACQWRFVDKERYLRLRHQGRARFLRQQARQAQTDDHDTEAFGFKLHLQQRALSPVIDNTVWVDRTHDQFTATLKVDLRNLFFFDHAYDHVPGVLMLEGMRHLYLDLAERFSQAFQPTALGHHMRLGFHHFAELDSPVTLTARTPIRRDDRICVEIDVLQQGRLCARGVFEGCAHSPFTD